MSRLVIVGCMVWCWLTEFVAFGFLLGGTIMYLWISQTSLDLSVCLYIYISSFLRGGEG